MVTIFYCYDCIMIYIFILFEVLCLSSGSQKEKKSNMGFDLNFFFIIFEYEYPPKNYFIVKLLY